MSSDTPFQLLLGPQRPDVNLGSAMAHSGIGDAPIAVISAAWQEAEGDIGDVQGLMANNPLHDLRLYQRAEAVFAADADLQSAYRERQDQLIEQQRMYRLRLRQLTIAAREILRMEGNAVAIAEERRHAISQLRALDRHHVRQIRKINARFAEQLSVEFNTLLADNLAELKEELSRFETVMMTGGNVFVLMNRLSLFGLDGLLQDKNIVAWSAGAMVLCDRIVLFHDRMPQGRRDSEVMGEGLGIVQGTVLLPDARGRVRKDDLIRSSLFSRRFSPATCLTLDNGSLLKIQNGRVRESESVQHISRDGRFVRVKAA
jgi:hypothetical protein